MSDELTEAQFLEVIERAPLVAIDLVVRDRDGAVLVGQRLNEPAAGTWFVPGGRVRKNEDLDEAFSRIAAAELGPGNWRRSASTLMGAYTHLHTTNALRVPGIETHYVVLAHVVDALDALNLPGDQHADYRWVMPDADLDDLHDLTAAYLRDLVTNESAGRMTDQQYEIINARRDVANNLVWQTPVVSLTGLAFLFSVLLAADTPASGRVIAALLAVCTCGASLHLSAKQRHFEEQSSKMADAYERRMGLYHMNARSNPTGPLLRRSAVKVWQWLYVVSAVAAIAAVILLW